MLRYCTQAAIIFSALVGAPAVALQPYRPNEWLEYRALLSTSKPPISWPGANLTLAVLDSARQLESVAVELLFVSRMTNISNTTLEWLLTKQSLVDSWVNQSNAEFDQYKQKLREVSASKNAIISRSAFEQAVATVLAVSLKLSEAAVAKLIVYLLASQSFHDPNVIRPLAAIGESCIRTQAALEKIRMDLQGLGSLENQTDVAEISLLEKMKIRKVIATRLMYGFPKLVETLAYLSNPVLLEEATAKFDEKIGVLNNVNAKWVKGALEAAKSSSTPQNGVAVIIFLLSLTVGALGLYSA